MKCVGLACVVACLLVSSPLFGSGPAVTFSPTSLTFPQQIIKTTSAGMNVTMTNTGTTTLTITSIAVNSVYIETNTCGSSLSAGKSSTITVSFAPTVTGTIAGTVTVTDNASGSPQTDGMTGTAIHRLYLTTHTA